MGPRSEEAGALVLIEVILVAVILLVTALPMLAKRDSGGATDDTDATWRSVGHRSERALETFAALPPANLTTREIDSELGPDFLSRLVRERFVDASSGRWNFASAVASAFPEAGVRTALGFTLRGQEAVLYTAGPAPVGAHNAGERDADPRTWGSAYLTSTVDPIDGTARMHLESLVVNRSRLARQPGEIVEAVVHLAPTSSSVPDWSAATSYTLVSQPPPGSDAAMVNLRWWRIASSGIGERLASRIPAADGTAPTANHHFELRAELVHGAVPRDAELRVLVERGFTAAAATSTPAGWAWIGATAHADGHDELRWRATTDHATPGAFAFTFEMRPDATEVVPVARLHATLANGALARSTAAVVFTAIPGDPATPREVHLSLPYALHPGMTARLGVLVLNSRADANVVAMNLTFPGGWDFSFRRGEPNRLVAGAANPNEGGVVTWPPGVEHAWMLPYPRWDVVRGELGWNGYEPIAAFGTAEFFVDVVVADVEGTSHDRTMGDYWGSRVRFDANAHEAFSLDGPGTWRRAPGLHRYQVPPATVLAPAGYPTPASGGGTSGLLDPNAMEVRFAHPPREPVIGPSRDAANYSIVGGLPGAAAVAGASEDSYVVPTHRLVEPGHTVFLEVDFQEVVRELRKLGDVADLRHRIDVYAPPSLPGRPIAVLQGDLDATVRAGVAAVRFGDTTAVSAGDEILVGGKDGKLRSFTTRAGVPPGETAVWTATVRGDAVDEVIAIEAGVGVDPVRAGLEIVTLTSLGTLRSTDAVGAEIWTRQIGAAAVALAIDTLAPGGRVYAVESSPPLLRVSAYAGDGTLAGRSAAEAAGSAAAVVVPYARPDGARAVLVLAEGGRFLDATTAAAGAWAATGPSAGVPLAGAAFDLVPGGGEEIVVVYEEGVATYNPAAGTWSALWLPDPDGDDTLAGDFPAVTRASASRDPADASRVDLALVATATTGQPYVVSARATPAGLQTVWTAPAFEIIDGQHIGPDRDGQCDGRDGGLNDHSVGNSPLLDPSEIVDGVAPTLCDDVQEAENIGQRVGDRVVYSTTSSAFETGQQTAEVVTAVSILRFPGDPAEPPRVAWGGRNVEARTRLAAATLATQDLLYTREVGSYPSPLPTTIGVVARPGLDPGVVTGFNTGALRLDSWTVGGTTGWPGTVSSTDAVGRLRYAVDVPGAALPGTYVVKASLVWTGGGVEQSVSHLNWFEVTFPDGAPLAGDYVLPVFLRAWMIDWDAPGRIG